MLSATHHTPTTTTYHHTTPHHHHTPHPTAPAPNRTTPHHTTHRTTSYRITLHHITPHRTAPYHNPTPHHNTTPHHTAQHHTYHPIPHRTTPHRTAPHHTTSHHNFISMKSIIVHQRMIFIWVYVGFYLTDWYDWSQKHRLLDPADPQSIICNEFLREVRLEWISLNSGWVDVNIYMRLSNFCPYTFIFCAWEKKKKKKKKTRSCCVSARIWESIEPIKNIYGCVRSLSLSLDIYIYIYSSICPVVCKSSIDLPRADG